MADVLTALRRNLALSEKTGDADRVKRIKARIKEFEKVEAKAEAKAVATQVEDVPKKSEAEKAPAKKEN